MVIISTMEIMNTNIMQTNTFISHMSMRAISSIFFIFFLTGCSSLSPGYVMESNKDRSNNTEYVLVDPDKTQKSVFRKA